MSAARPVQGSDAALAVILARAGSKGLPRKNMLPIAGKPCAQWTIEAAQAARRVSRVVVSTDNDDLLALASRLGAITVRRPIPLASDTATIDDAARHAVREVQPDGHSSQPIVILYANVPIRPVGESGTGLIDRAVAMLVEQGADSVQSYQPVGKFHPWWTARVDPQTGFVMPWEGDTLNHGVFRRQDLPPAFIPDGGVIAVTRSALFLELGVAPPTGPHAFFGRPDRRRGIINAEGSVVDIDSRIDLLVADAMLRG